MWKLTPSGAVHAITTPLTLFSTVPPELPCAEQANDVAEQHRGKELTSLRHRWQHDCRRALLRAGAGADGTGALVPPEATSATKNTTITMKRKPRINRLLRALEGQNGIPSTHDRQTTVIDHQSTNRSCNAARTSTDASDSGGDGSKRIRIASSSLENCGPQRGIDNQGGIVTPTTDRFGHLIRSSRCRAEGPVEGTLEPLGWGWGGQFRLGTGHDGEKHSPGALHPGFKVRPQGFEWHTDAIRWVFRRLFKHIRER